MSFLNDLLKKYTEKSESTKKKNELEKALASENSADELIKEKAVNQSVENASISKEAEAMNKIAALQKEFDDTTLASTKQLDLQKLSYEAPTDDELMSEARKSLESKYSTKRNDAITGSDNKKKALEEALAALIGEADAEKSATDENYKKAIAETENSALKRGVARSSMAQGAVNELIKENLEKKTAIDEAAKKRTSELSESLAAIKDELAAALASIDSAEADDIAAAFDKLKAESNKKAEDVVKYNNTVEEKIADHALKTYNVKTQEEIDKIKNDYDYKKLGVALDYYLSLDDPNKALSDFLNNRELESYLGNYYEYLRNILRNRAKTGGGSSRSGTAKTENLNEIM